MGFVAVNLVYGVTGLWLASTYLGGLDLNEHDLSSVMQAHFSDCCVELKCLTSL